MLHLQQERTVLLRLLQAILRAALHNRRQRERVEDQWVREKATHPEVQRVNSDKRVVAGHWLLQARL